MRGEGGTGKMRKEGRRGLEGGEESEGRRESKEWR